MADAAAPTDKVKVPLDTATALALGVWTLVLIALICAVIADDRPLASDISKNFIGPGFLIVMGYYFGSTSSGRRKDETIASMAQQSGTGDGDDTKEPKK